MWMLFCQSDQLFPRSSSGVTTWVMGGLCWDSLVWAFGLSLHHKNDALKIVVMDCNVNV